MSLPIVFNIPGTPRTASKKKSDSQREWEKHIKKKLKKEWGKKKLPQGTKIKVNIVFKKRLEGSDSHEHGPDLDNLLKPVLDKIAEVMLPNCGKNKKEKGDFLIYKVIATKRIVKSIRSEGVRIRVEEYQEEK